jgi:nitrate reductase alpha subunit
MADSSSIIGNLKQIETDVNGFMQTIRARNDSVIRLSSYFCDSQKLVNKWPTVNAFNPAIAALNGAADILLEYHTATEDGIKILSR